MEPDANEGVGAFLEKRSARWQFHAGGHNLRAF
jgi:hypothetical protein